jgi:Gas vesicle protein K
MSPRRSRRAPARRKRARTRKERQVPANRPVDVLEPDLEAIRRELERAADASSPPRWNANPEDVRRSVVKLVLTLVELLRKLMERQAIRRMEQGTLTDEETEKLGTSLMRLEETIREIGAQFDLRPEDLNLDLGPVGKLM